METTIAHSLRPEGWLMGHTPIRSLPPKGLAIDDVRSQLRGYAAKEEAKWQGGFVSGAVYGGEEEIVALMGEAATLYGLSNPLHPDLFASVMRFEAEVCAMVAQMVNGGDPGVCACLTSGGQYASHACVTGGPSYYLWTGAALVWRAAEPNQPPAPLLSSFLVITTGTESIILAAKAHRDYFREAKGVTTSQPEIVACVSAHAAIQKAADLMGLRLVLVPMREDFRADVKAM